jgi:hypothetical protein
MSVWLRRTILAFLHGAMALILGINPALADPPDEPILLAQRDRTSDRDRDRTRNNRDRVRNNDGGTSGSGDQQAIVGEPSIVDAQSDNGAYAFEIVGESFYQQELERIVGSRSEASADFDTEALLVYEPDNPADPSAIRVDIGGMTVGHLSRDDAQEHRRRMESNGLAGATVRTEAKIVGGWDRGADEVGFFGVKLDMPAFDGSGGSGRSRDTSPRRRRRE